MLQRPGKLDDTFVVVAGDNNFHMGEHRLRPGKTVPTCVEGECWAIESRHVVRRAPG